MQEKRKRSTLITVIAVIIIAASLLAYKYAYLVYREYEYITEYEDVHGLQRSNPIFIDGVRVGEVSDITLNGGKKVTVTFSIGKHIKIPRGSIAYIASKGILGEKMVLLEKGSGPGYYKHMDRLTGMYDTSVLDMGDQVAPMIESAKYILNTADKNFSNFNRKLDNGLVEQTQKNVKSMEQSMNIYKQQSVAIGEKAGGIINQLLGYKQSSNELAKKMPGLDSTIKNTELSTADLAQQPYAKQIDTLRQTVSKANNTIEEVSANKTLEKALNNKKEYTNLNEELSKTNAELESTRKNPKGISLIGGGKD